MPKVCKVLINFIDGSYLYAELSRKIEGADTAILCHRVIGLPEGAPTDKPTIAGAAARTASSGNCIELVIPLARVASVSVQEEYLGKDVPSDMLDMWK